MRRILTLLIALLAVESAGAEVVYVVFRDRKIEKRYAQYLTKFDGLDCLIGEPKSGIRFADGVINFSGGPEAKNALWVSDPAQPDKPPYKFDKKTGKRVQDKRGKGWVVSFPGNDVQGIAMLDPAMTLAGYAREYHQRMLDIEAMQSELKKVKRSTKPWFDLHGKVIARYVRLQSWLRSVGFPKAAEKLEKTVNKERKVIAKQAAAEREKEALASVRQIETPASLIEASKNITGGRVEFHVHDSKHMRITHTTDLADERVVAALTLAEVIVEGFRREFVDPYVDEEFPDTVPEELILEFFFGPEDLQAHERFLTEYYGVSWGQYKEAKMAASGAAFLRDEPPYYLNYRKLLADIDLEGYVAHGMGSALADLHFNAGARNDVQPWLMEGAGYYMSLSYLGRNSMTTFADAQAEYAQAAQESGVKTAQNGMKGMFNQVALTSGPKIDALAIQPLYQLDDPSYAKSWSFFDWVARKEGRDGQVWLRRTCAAAGDPQSFMVTWRALTEEMNPVDDGVDVFDELEQRWRVYAEREQVLVDGVPERR